MFYSKLFNKYNGNRLLLLFLVVFSAYSHAQTTPDTRRSATRYLSPQLQALQSDTNANPASLWVGQGQSLLTQRCAACHADTADLTRSVASFPKLSTAHADGKTLINLEDQVMRCQQRAGATARLESESTLALSAALHQAAKGQRIEVRRPQDAQQAQQWQAQYDAGARLYSARMGRINLACLHCHDERAGAQMRGDVISEAHPTGFPIYRLAWQGLGSLERRLRACYSGVQAPLPAPGSVELRQLELYLKVRANGMELEGSSVRR